MKCEATVIVARTTAARDAVAEVEDYFNGRLDSPGNDTLSRNGRARAQAFRYLQITTRSGSFMWGGFSCVFCSSTKISLGNIGISRHTLREIASIRWPPLERHAT